MTLITLSKGYKSIIDDGDYARVKQFKWYAKLDRRKDGTVRNVYAARTVYNLDDTQGTLSLHRFIMEVNDSAIKIDHEDHDGLNNQRHNLRVCNDVQNTRNARKRPKTGSKYKGVSRFGQEYNKWQGRVTVDGKVIYLGAFDTEVEAALAYNAAAQQLHGKFAHLNNIEAMP